MKIRTRLALQFMLLSSLVMGVSFLIIYTFTSYYHKNEFKDRMRNRGMNAAKLLIQVDEVSEALLSRIEQDNPVRLPEESIRIFDHHNTLIFHLDAVPLAPTDPSVVDEVRLSGEHSSRNGDRDLIAFPFNDRYDRFVVVVSGNDLFGRSKLKNLRNILLITFILGPIFTFVVGRLYAERSLKPLSALVGELHTFNATNLGQRLAVNGSNDEVDAVAHSFNELMTRLESSFRSQRNFIANASHEMRTPLTTISGQLEVLLLKERDAPSYRTALTSVLDDMHALNRLADRLLLLAQAEATATASSFARVRLDELLWFARQETLKADKAAVVDVVIDNVEEEEDLNVFGNDALLRSMLINLMENACKYADDHRARVKLYGSEQTICISVSNTGPPIDPEDQERIFEPFHRGRNSTRASGHGIGLSLVRRIAQLHHGAVHLRSSAVSGTRFTVVLPKMAA
ncbi:MAG: HAMP domain-containing histidine kinase [Flavobacteriales bacterium]|jgi:signal transduction histidine kinase|nr:HAMP domain-containing histidine kinase [Flavobacteriales bacterium]